MKVYIRALSCICMLALMPCAQNNISAGVVVGKTLNHKTNVVVKRQVSKGSVLYFEYEFNYPATYVILFEDNNGNSGKCDVSKTIYNIINIGEAFDCQVLGKKALDEAVIDD